MPRRRSRRQSKSTAAAISLAIKAIAAAISALTLATIAYYNWASKVVSSKRRIAAYLAPVGLVAMVSIVGLAAPSQPVAKPAPQAVYEYDHDFEAAAVTEPKVGKAVEAEIAVELEPEIEPEPEAYSEPESYVEPEPISNNIGFIGGSCKDLKAQGLGPFYPGDANYTSKRDRDNDGIACE